MMIRQPEPSSTAVELGSRNQHIALLGNANIPQATPPKKRGFFVPKPQRENRIRLAPQNAS